jgi:hypothetical protein
MNRRSFVSGLLAILSGAPMTPQLAALAGALPALNPARALFKGGAMKLTTMIRGYEIKWIDGETKTIVDTTFVR